MLTSVRLVGRSGLTRASSAPAMVLALLLSACGGSAPEEVPAEAATEEARPLDVKQIARLARAIQIEPTAAESILKDAGYDRASFEALLYAVAADPEASEQYLKLLR